jgi:AP2-like factor (euAP2 lineage)
MKEIQLTKGYVALVDDEDFERVNQFKWCADVHPHTVYGTRSVRTPEGKKTTQSLHRFVSGVTDPETEVDHKDHNGLNCQRYNLRPCTHQQNLCSRQKLKGVSQFKGVSWDYNKWRAEIKLNGKTVVLGRYVSENEAAAAYKDAAVQHFGEFTNTAFKELQ